MTATEVATKIREIISRDLAQAESAANNGDGRDALIDIQGAMAKLKALIRELEAD